jgi:CubicO group peptidase (beta-lactamase class C family)
MTTPQIMPEQKAGSEVFLGGSRSWGFGMSIFTHRDDVASAPGRFGWDGGLGTSWYSDPKEDMVGILMTQVLGFPSRIDLDFWTSVYQAIDD